jgi:hypothetical protein
MYHETTKSFIDTFQGSKMFRPDKNTSDANPSLIVKKLPVNHGGNRSEFSFPSKKTYCSLFMSKPSATMFKTIEV